MPPCAACKHLRQKCTKDCIFAPYFPPDQPHRFLYLQKVYGAANVAKVLNNLHPNHRDDAVNSLVYEAEFRLRDPIYGCVGFISILQHNLLFLQHHLENANRELATCVDPQAMLPINTLQLPLPDFMSLAPQPETQTPSSSSAYHQHDQNMFPMMAIPTGESFIRDQEQQINFEAQQLAAVNAVATEQENEMFRAYVERGGSNNSHHHQNQHQVEISQFNHCYDSVTTGSTGFNQLNSDGTTLTGIMSSSLALGGNCVDSPQTNINYHTDQQFHQQQQQESQIFMLTQSSQSLSLQTQETQTQTNSERSVSFFKKEE